MYGYEIIFTIIFMLLLFTKGNNFHEQLVIDENVSVKSLQNTGVQKNNNKKAKYTATEL